MLLIAISLISFGFAMFGVYVWGEDKKEFDGKLFVLAMFFFGVIFMAYAGYDLGMGKPNAAIYTLEKDAVYTVQAKVKKGNQMYVLVMSEHGNMYAVTFDNQPPAKFKVVEDEKGQVYIAVP